MAWGRGSESAADSWARRLSAQDPTFRSLCVLPSRSFSHEDVAKLSDALEGNTTLQELSGNGHPMAPETATLLATALARNITLRSLAVGDTNFGDAGAAALAPGLAASASLQRLDLSAKGIGPDGAAAIGGALAANPAAALTHLSIAGNALGDTGLRGLLPGLLMLRSLDLTCCGLNSGGSDAMPLLQGVLLQGQLTSLCLDGNALGAAAGASLGDGAAACTSLRKLSVVDTGLGDAGLSALAARLPAASLTQLNASGCAADRGGATALFDAVSSGAPLATLSLRANHLTAGDVAAALATALPPQLANGGGPSLANGSAAVANGAAGAVEPTVAAVPADGVPAAAVEAAAGFALQQLDLSENEGAADAPAVAALAQLTGLRRLSLFGCTGGDDVAREAAAQLAAGSWPHLKELDLGGNELSQEGLSAVLDAVRCGGGTALEVLLLGANPGCDDAEEFADVVRLVQAARPGVDVVFRAAAGMV